MSDDALNSDPPPDIKTREQSKDASVGHSTHSTTTGNTPIPALVGLLTLVVLVFAISFSERNATGSKALLPGPDAPPLVVTTDEELEQSASQSHVRAQETGPAQQAVADLEGTSVKPGSKKSLSPATSRRKSAMSGRDTFPTIAYSVGKWLAIFSLALIVAYDLVKAVNEKMFYGLLVLAIGFGLWLCCSMVLLRSAGMILAAVAFLTISHHIHARRFRGAAFIIGLFIGVLAFGCAVVGTLHRLERCNAGPIESASVAMYEATQVLMMNMAPHEPLEDSSQAVNQTSNEILSVTSPDLVVEGADTAAPTVKSLTSVEVVPSAERDWFTAARIFATLLALFIAYQILTHYARNAVYRSYCQMLCSEKLFQATISV